jgi:hypothetical protein
MFVSIIINAQQTLQPTISEMKWGIDYNLHVKLSNDTNFVMDVRGLYHTGKNLFIDTTDQSSTYYPVTLDDDFINHIKNRKLDEEHLKIDTTDILQAKTLWSALHSNLGGGYIHFINCLIYTLESQQLYLAEPVMRRPSTDWKPNPMTESYKRTRKWEFYFPHTQKLAHKEYHKRKKENDLKDLQGVPASFIELFLKTSQHEYMKLRENQKKRIVAQIDLVRLILGAKYLGQTQIQYIRSKVHSAILKYNVNSLPSVIIFDDYNAAVSMTLDHAGYKIGHVVFRDQDLMSSEEGQLRIQKIESLIKSVNEANEKVFKKRLERYYQKTK